MPRLPDNLPQPDWRDDEFGVALYCADCMDVLPLLPKVDAAVTDPPYDMTASGGGIMRHRQYKIDIENTGMADGFNVSMLSGFTRWVCFCAKSTIVTLIQQAEKQGLRWQLVTWNKTNPTPLCNRNYLPDTEYIIHAFRRLPDCDYRDKSRWILGAVEKNNIGHPTVKPLYVIERVIRTSTVCGETILDPFMGSGTTGVACVNLGRAFIGIEREKKYFNVAVDRIREAIIKKQNGPLFATHRPAQQTIFEGDQLA